MERDLRALHSDVLSHDVDHKFERLCRAEPSVALFELALFDHFEVENVVDQADKQIDLRYHYENNASLSLVKSHLQQAL